MGHEVIVSAFSGLAGAPIAWDGFKILPSVFDGDPFGAAILGEHFRREQCDLIITLCDLWALEPAHLKGLPVASWMPVDCSPLSLRDERALKISGAVPIAMSPHGERMLRDAGLDPLYVPHGLDLDVFSPAEDRDGARKQLGVDGLFTIGINAANKDAFRKGMAEQYEAFARLHAAHPDTALLVHSMLSTHNSLDLRVLGERLGLEPGAVRYVDQYALLTGQVADEHLVRWYSALDLYSACSLGEGFCLPAVEAMGCGIPVVATDCSALADVAAGQWLVPGEPFWNPTHGSFWRKPSIAGIHKIYETAYLKGRAYEAKRRKARASAQRFAVDRVAEEYWKPVLATLQERFCKPVTLTEPAAPAVSVCFASRGRPESLARTLRGLVELAAEPDQVEIMVATDPDDEVTRDWLAENGDQMPPGVAIWTAPERFGYTRLHAYLNALARQARGEWIQWWNDDFVMVTPGWDKVIRANRPAILWPHANHVGHANIAPAWPKAWSDAIGHVSPTTHMDTYLQRLGEALGRHDPIAVEIVHDRADVTGNHDDLTYAEGRKLLGPEGMAPGFDAQAMYEQVAKDAAIIQELLA